jgi:hypothetical protein
VEAGREKTSLAGFHRPYIHGSCRRLDRDAPDQISSVPRCLIRRV